MINMKGFDIKKIFKKFIRLRDKDKLKMEITPHRDWRILVVVFAVLVIIVAAVSFYSFMHIGNDDIFLSRGGDRSAVKMLDTQKLKNIIQAFQARADELAGMRANRPHVVDPSQ